MKHLLVLIGILLAGCTQDSYNNNYLSFTNYNLSDFDKYTTPKGVKVYYNKYPVDLYYVDTMVDELEQCIQISIKRDWFVVLVPDDWFTSQCPDSDEQLLPYSAPIQLCEAKGVTIPPQCERDPYQYSVPTQECTCPCNWRVATQDDYIIVTPPNFKLFKAELARVVTGVNNPWSSDFVACLR